MLTTGTLPATKTRSNWSFTFVAATEPTALADGQLVVIEETGKVKKRTVTSTYGVQEQPSRGCRRFLLLKAGHAGNLDTACGRAAAIRCGEVYEVTVGGARPGCTCPGFAAGKRTCKHMIALTELLSVGDIPSPFANADADHANTEQDAPAHWPLARRVEATPGGIEAAAEFLRRLT